MLVSGPTPLDRLPPSRPAYIRGSVDWLSVAKTLATNGSSRDAMLRVHTAFQGAGLDFDSDVLGSLLPGFAVSLGVAPTLSLDRALDLATLTTDPLQNYSVIAIARVKDAGKAQSVLAKLPAALEALGGTIASHVSGGETIYSVRYRQAEALSWMLHHDEIIFAGGTAEEADTVLASVARGKETLSTSEFTPQAATVMFGDSGLALAVDFARLGDAVKKAPAESGPAAMIASYLEDKLKDVEHLKPVVAITPAEGGMVVGIIVTAK